MRKYLSIIVAAVAALALAAPAGAATYNGNNLTTGTNVCPASISIVQGGGNFNSVLNVGSNGGCSIPADGGHPAAFFTPVCKSTIYRVTPGATSNTGLQNCGTWAALSETFSHWGGTVYFRLDLNGLANQWRDPCGAGVDCFIDGEFDIYQEHCHIGPLQKVRECTFTRDI